MSRRLATRTLEKVWGRKGLAAPFSHDPEMQIGEIWFEPQAPHDSLLVKYLFTSEKLSVQVHPSNADAQRMGLGAMGKEECWLILDAEPGAAVALGLNRVYAKEDVRAAALDGSIEGMLVWHEAKPGDFFHVPPGTIHAIGPGLTLLEIQQNTDITFRLFDYGRPRELHLDQAMQCADFAPYPAQQRSHVRGDAREVLLDGSAFTVTLLKGPHEMIGAEDALVIPLRGYLVLGDERIDAGDCAMLAEGDRLMTSKDPEAIVAQSQ